MSPTTRTPDYIRQELLAAKKVRELAKIDAANAVRNLSNAEHRLSELLDEYVIARNLEHGQ